MELHSPVSHSAVWYGWNNRVGWQVVRITEVNWCLAVVWLDYRVGQLEEAVRWSHRIWFLIVERTCVLPGWTDTAGSCVKVYGAWSVTVSSVAVKVQSGDRQCECMEFAVLRKLRSQLKCIPVTDSASVRSLISHRITITVKVHSGDRLRMYGALLSYSKCPSVKVHSDGRLCECMELALLH